MGTEFQSGYVNFRESYMCSEFSRYIDMQIEASHYENLKMNFGLVAFKTQRRPERLLKEF